MSFELMPDKQIIKTIASSLEKKRLQKRIKVEDLAKKGGFNPQTYSNFLNKGTDIRLSTLLQIIRGLGELDEFKRFFQQEESLSLFGETARDKIKRVRTPKITRNAFVENYFDNNSIVQVKVVPSANVSKSQMTVAVLRVNKNSKTDGAKKKIPEEVENIEEKFEKIFQLHSDIDKNKKNRVNFFKKKTISQILGDEHIKIKTDKDIKKLIALKKSIESITKKAASER